MKENIEKSAMSDAEKMKYVKAAIVSAVATAGIGSFVKEWRTRKSRAKAMKTEDSKNAIVIPIKKTKFMEGLPTPEELASSRGETGNGSVKTDVQADAAQMSAEDIAAKKKEILRGRKVNFLGKRAEKKDESCREGSHSADGVADEKKSSGSRESKERTSPVLRDQSGRFASPTDPVAVEKAAAGDGFWGGLWDTLAHPIDSAGMVLDAAKDKPVMFTAGAIGSVYLAAKISDIINKRRRERAKERLEDARDQYVNILQGENPEKKADAEKTATDPRTMAGTVLGGAFFIPMAITALVTNRIIENRREEKKKQKEMSDSYPDDPIILYKTSDDHEIKMSPEAALAVISVKRGMILSSEMGKFAQDGGLLGLLKAKAKEFGEGATQMAQVASANPYTIQEASEWAANTLSDEKNKNWLLQMSRAYADNDNAAAEKAFSDMVRSQKTPESYRFLRTMAQDMEKNKAAVRNYLSTSQKVQDATVRGYSSDDPGFAKHREELVGKGLAGTFKPGSFLHNIMAWFINTFGIGKNQVVQGINDRFMNARRRADNSSSANPVASAQRQEVVQRPAVRQAPVQRQNVGMNAPQNTGSKSPSVPGVKNTNMS